MNKSIILLIIIIFLLLVGGGTYFYLQSQKKQQIGIYQPPSSFQKEHEEPLEKKEPTIAKRQVFKTMKQAYTDLKPLIDSEGKNGKINSINSVQSGCRIMEEREYKIRPDGTSNYWAFVVLYPHTGCNFIWANGTTEKSGCGKGMLLPGGGYEGHSIWLEIDSIPDSNEYFTKANTLVEEGTVGELQFATYEYQDIKKVKIRFYYYDEQERRTGDVECGATLDSCKKLPDVLIRE